MVEVSRPTGLPLRTLFLFYLNRIIPIIGVLFMGNAEVYRMLGRYCAYFGNCRNFKKMLERRGLEVAYLEYFFGCATGVSGRKR